MAMFLSGKHGIWHWITVSCSVAWPCFCQASMGSGTGSLSRSAAEGHWGQHSIWTQSILCRATDGISSLVVIWQRET